MADLLIYGAGGLWREVAQLAADLRADGGSVEPVGFLSHDVSSHGTIVGGLPVLGDHTYVEKHSGRFHLVLGVGSPSVKQRLVEKVSPYVRAFPHLVHPSVIHSSHISWGRGVIVCSASSLTVDIRLGDFVLVNIGCTIGHDCVIGDFATITPGANISGRVVTETGCDIGTGAAVIQGIVIGEWTLVGAGAAVITSLPANCTAVGVPARPVKHRPPGWQLGTST